MKSCNKPGDWATRGVCIVDLPRAKRAAYVCTAGILIDDPIAHVDDLNSLSFLDYLRDVALTGRRQIFFASADDKLATLFERRFDLLGPEDFRRFDLRREARSVTG